MDCKAIFFDFDGVLADTEELHFDLFREIVRIEGYDLDRGDYYQTYIGYDDQEFFVHFYKNVGKNITQDQIEKWIHEKDKRFLNAISSRDILFPGVKEMISKLAKRFPLVIVSGALRNEIETICSNAGILDSFQFIICPGDYSQGKPHPEPYMKALKKLNQVKSSSIKPHECIVVEDTPYGLKAGKKAGMQTIGVIGSCQADELKMADQVIDSIEKLPLATFHSNLR